MAWMRSTMGRRLLAAVMLMIVAGLGCNPLLIPTYIIQGFRSGKVNSQFNFYDRAHEAKKKKEIKVVVISYRGKSLSPEYIGAERMLTNMFVGALKSNFQQNKERVTVVSPTDVEKFKQQHDDWRAMEVTDIAKHFNADYVIDIELAAMTLYEPGSRDLFRGHCHIPILIKDADKDAVEIFPPYDFETDYPGGGEAIQAGFDMSAERFQQKFFAKIATSMAGLFSATETSKEFTR